MLSALRSVVLHRRSLIRGGAVAAACAGLSACGFEPRPPVMDFAPSPETRDSFEDAGMPTPAVDAERVEGALQLLFGSPRNPGYLALDEWLDEERDPNFGQDELDDDAWEAIEADNEVRFARQLAAVRAGAYAGVPRPWGADHAWSRWSWAFSELIEGVVQPDSLHPDSPTEDEADEDWPTFTWADEAERFWRLRYPTLEASAALYQRHCTYCHGATGAGDGPSGETLDPAPRDFRRGVFKWTAVESGYRPRRADLERILAHGVEGTAMPSFARLTRAEREGLVDWVRLLSLRGETELLLTALSVQREAVSPELSQAAYIRAWQRWDEAEERYASVGGDVPNPDAFTAEAIARGAAVFVGEVAKCSTCHGDDARGDGDAIWELVSDGERQRRLDSWGQPSRPRDLTEGVFRGGDRPADLYRRIKFGIGGTIMPAADPNLPDEDIWALVAYVLSLRS